MSQARSRRALGARIVPAALAATAAAAAAIPAVAAAHTGAHAARVPSCKASQLVNWLDTDPNGTAGTIYYQLKFTNFGGTCTLRGYPGVSAVSLGGHQLGAPARRVKGVKVKTVTLHQGRTVSAALGIEEVGAIPVGRCHARPAAGIRVFAPNTSTAPIIPFPYSACSAKGASSMVIRPVR
jgi:hypothetical protein